DEAGQMSLATAVAAGSCARALVLLGDPNQLAQVTQGMHPDGAEKSALEHVIGEQATIPPERGLFLPETWRLHPAVCRYVSEAFSSTRWQPLRPRTTPATSISSIRGTGSTSPCPERDASPWSCAVRSCWTSSARRPN